MTPRSLILLLALTALCPGAGSLVEEEFDQGIKALALQDWDRAFASLENALAADPDNIRYGSEYRQAVLLRARTVHGKEGRVQDFDRPLRFFDELVSRSPNAPNAYLNYGFAYVDKIPAAGAITQVILANTALGYFTKSLELKTSWIGLYSRGASYLFWPRIFGRAKLGVTDLEEALKIQNNGPKKAYHVRTWIALGDGYWKTDDLDRARSTWTQGSREFPTNAALKERLAKQGDDLKTLIDDSFDPSKRVDTNLRELWTNP
jgi:tetratricopeptide (TPR) repeat protein